MLISIFRDRHIECANTNNASSSSPQIANHGLRQQPISSNIPQSKGSSPPIANQAAATQEDGNLVLTNPNCGCCLRGNRARLS